MNEASPDIPLFLKDSLRRFFHIRRGEEVRASLMLCYIFLIVASLMIVKPVCQALFLSELGALKLPYAYILVAFSAVAVSSLYSRMLKKISLNRLITRTLQIAILSLFIFWILLRTQYVEGWVLYVFYIWVAIFAVISVSQFWILANVLFNAREAKRLFGFIGSGAIAGGIIGGYLTNFLAPVLGSEQLIFICIGFLSLCIPLARRLWAECLQSKPLVPDHAHGKPLEEEEHPIRKIIKSRHLALLAGIMGVSVLVAKLVDYQFSAVAAAKILEEDQLTAFFGFWLSNLNIASLLIQLFMTRHVVGVFGVGTSLFFLPVGILLGALAVLIHPALWAVILLKMSDGSLKNSVNKAGLELLALPIPPDLKNQTRPFIDVFGDSLATGIGGTLLVILTIVSGVSTRPIGLMIVGLIVVWLFMVVRMKKEYLRTMRIRIAREPSAPEEEEIDLRKESVIGGVVKILEGPDESRILETLKIIREVRNDRFLPSLGRLLHHPSCAVRAEALCDLYFYRNPGYVSEVRDLVKDTDPNVQAEAIHYLFQNADDRIGMLLSYLEQDNLSVRMAALYCAAIESRNNAEYQRAFQVQRRVDGMFREMHVLQDAQTIALMKAACARIIGAAEISGLQPYLFLLLKDACPNVIREVIVNAGKTRNNECIPILLRRLGDPEYEDSVEQAFMYFGSEIVPVLVHFLNNPAEAKNVRLRIPRIIGSIGVQRSANALIQNLDHPDPELQQEIIRALNRLRLSHPELRFEESKIVGRILEEARLYTQSLAALYTETRTYEGVGAPSPGRRMKVSSVKKARQALIKALEIGLDSRLERIFRLLGLKYPPDDIYNVYLGVKSGEPDIRLNAVEFLDNVLSPDLKKVVIPIVETTLMDALIEKTLEQFGVKFPSEFDCLSTLLTGDDHRLTLLTLSLIDVLEDDAYIPHLVGLINHLSPKVRDRVGTILQKMRIL